MRSRRRGYDGLCLQLAAGGGEPERGGTGVLEVQLRVCRSDADGGELGRATSEWMLINLAARKVVAIPEAVFAAANTVREPVFGDEPLPKLRWECSAESPDALVFRARRGDIDLNGHVNNVHYVEWLMEGRPGSAGPCRELEIVFKSETLAGEEVRVESVETEPDVFVHRVYAPDGRDHVLARTAR